MQLDKILRLTIILCLFISCKNDAQEKNKVINKVNIVASEVDFFKKTSKNFYTMLIDESNVSDHPIVSNLDCKHSYFTIHFVPKSDSLKEFWKKDFFTNYNFNDINLEKDHAYIQDKLKNKNQYNIFSLKISKEYFDTKNGCTEESINLKKVSKAQIYLFNSNNKTWKLVKEISTDFLPPYADNNFFTLHFPDLFTTKSNNSEDVNDSPVLQKDVVFQIDANFNTANVSEKIIVLKDARSNDIYDQQHFNLPIRIYQKDKLWKSNNHLIADKKNNCVSEGFSNIVVKNNYFTIEYQSCYDYNILVSAYVTFKVIGNDIYLYKYGENYFDKSNHEKKIPSKLWSEKDFRKIKFEDVSNSFLESLK